MRLCTLTQLPIVNSIVLQLQLISLVILLVSRAHKFVRAMDSSFVERIVFLFAPETIQQSDLVNQRSALHVCVHSLVSLVCLLTACTAWCCCQM